MENTCPAASAHSDGGAARERDDAGLSIAKARAIVAAFEAQPKAGVIGLNGEMLDLPNLTKARRLLAGYREN